MHEGRVHVDDDAEEVANDAQRDLGAGGAEGPRGTKRGLARRQANQADAEMGIGEQRATLGRGERGAERDLDGRRTQPVAVEARTLREHVRGREERFEGEGVDPMKLAHEAHDESRRGRLCEAGARLRWHPESLLAPPHSSQVSITLRDN